MKIRSIPQFSRAPVVATLRSKPLVAGLALALATSVAPVIAGTPATGAAFANSGVGSELDPAEVFARLQRRAAPVAAELLRPARLTGAATHFVSNCNDSGAGSLRDTVNSPAVVSGDTIDLKNLDCDITLDTVLLITEDSLSLVDSSVSTGEVPDQVIRAAPGNTGGLLTHGGNGSLYLRNLIIENGTKYRNGADKYADGGCIGSSGDVTLVNSLVRDCTAENPAVAAAPDGGARGGAIAADGQVTLLYSVVSGSLAHVDTGPARGGGIFAEGGISMKYSALLDNESRSDNAGPPGAGRGGGAFLRIGYGETGGAGIVRSLIANNSADIAGGLFVGGIEATFTLDSSTVTQNDASFPYATAAGIYLNNGGDISISNSTITANHNHTNNPGGLGLKFSPTAVPDSILFESNLISGNTGFQGGQDIPFDMEGALTPIIVGSHNLVGVVDANLEAELPSDTIQQVDAPMGPLQDNGGALASQLPATGNWAFNHGIYFPNELADPESDQRGFPREVGTRVDIGAVESDALFLSRFEAPPLL